MSNFENEPAFPVSSIDGFTQHGMTLRDWFAGQVLPVFVPEVLASDFPAHETPARSAHFAYQVADAMLAARSEQPK